MLQRTVNADAEWIKQQRIELQQRRKRNRRIWRNLVSVMACVVVFCVTYALILPAITMEKETFCGVEAHAHEAACYEGHAIGCAPAGDTGLPVLHSHDAFCYEEETLICQLPELSGHVHAQSCYETVTVDAHFHDETCSTPVRGELICQLVEDEGHRHTDACRITGQTLLCEEAERTGHSHGESCYAEVTSRICQMEESEEHSHTEECSRTESVLTCQIPEDPGHAHTDGCYEKVLNCGQEEREGHSHSDGCFEMVSSITCGREETAESTSETRLVCGLTQMAPHNHAQACYDADGALICTVQNAIVHQHTEDCPWTGAALICEKQEHEHQLMCFSDRNADVETAADWEKTISGIELTGDWREDTLRIAKSQMGYEESSKNYIVDESGNIKGYSRYGAWYGDRYGDWCAMFVSFCLRYAQVPDMPTDANCPNWIRTLTEMERYQEAAVYTPVPGDLIFFDWNANGSADHVGLVAEIIPAEGNDPAMVRTIEGNANNCVKYNKYTLEDVTILGYGLLTEDPGYVQFPLEEQTLAVEIYTDGTYAETAEDETVITVSGMMPEGAEARAYPVTLETNVIDGQSVILAYDISIFYGDGQLFEQADTPLDVAIRPADWEEQPEDAAYNIYYIPEEGEPEPVDTTADEASVSFRTDHFSTYAMTTGGTLQTVYLNGTSGNDSNGGSSANGAVKTIERAMALVKDGGTIYISGTVTVADEQEWDVESKVTIKRYSSFTGPLINVVDGGSLVLSNITINGGSGKPAANEPNFSRNLSTAPDIATNNDYASGSAKAPLIVVDEDSRMTIKTGAVLEYNSNKPNTSGGYFAQSGYIGLGGAIYCSGTLTMNGGTIQYCEAQSGGGIYLDGGAFYLQDGLIDHNYARDIEEYTLRYGKDKKYHQNAGGGVYVGENSTMVMSGGTISYNQSSREGGGISLGWLNRNNGAYFDEYVSIFTMNGGTITHNTATSTGGGLNITAGYQAIINAGEFTYNVAYGKEYQPGEGDTSVWSVYSGGAIYVDASGWDSNGNHKGVPGKAVLNRALITQNTAINGGGGIAACQTSTNFVYGDATNGTAIYANKLFGGTSSNELYISSSAGQTISDKLLGNGKYNWTKSGTTYSNSLTEQSAAVKTARSLATVFITNNYAHLGGGIGCNGLIEVGGEKYDSTYINIVKKWVDNGLVVHPEFIEVQILQDGKNYGKPIRIYRTYDQNGNEVWPTFYQGGLPSGHTYTIVELEIPGYEAIIEGNGKDFVITNKQVGYQVTKKWVTESGSAVTEDLPGSIKVQLYQNGVAYGDPVELNAANGWKYEWPEELPEKDASGNAYVYTVEELEVPDGFYLNKIEQNGKAYVITNAKSAVTTISVEKQWAADTEPAESVQVQLYQNGVAYRDPVTLNAGNGWFYKWDDLPVKTTAGTNADYTVQELPIPCYSSSVEETVFSTEDKTEYWWEKVTTLENGHTYLFVNSSSQALAGKDSSGLTWITVSSNLTNGTEPDDAALWTYNSSKLRNGDSKYLTVSSTYNNYKFTIGSQGTNIVFTDGKLSYRSSNRTYYFSGISSSSGSTTTTERDGMTFTAYERKQRTIEGEENIHFIITNTAKPAELEVTFAKYSTGTDANGNPALLEGAELKLYMADPEGDIIIPGTGETGVLIDEWTSKKISSDPDAFHSKLLLSGTYYLVETKAPEGHAGLKGPIKFLVDAKTGIVTVADYPGRPGQGLADGVLPIYNTAMVLLPETGGPGKHLYTMAGLMLMLFSTAFLLYRFRKRRREVY